MTIFFIVVLIVLYIHNTIKNKKILLTLLLSFITILITYLTNIEYLSYGEDIVGINTRIFGFISIIIFVMTLIHFRRYKNKKRLFLLIGLYTLFVYGLSNTYSYGGLILSGKEYFLYNFYSYLNYLIILLIQVNLYILYVQINKIETKEENE